MARSIPMKKSGNIYTYILSALALAAVAFAVFSLVTRSLENSLETTAVHPIEYGYGCTVSGFVVRGESVLTTDCPITSLTVAEGQKVSAGQVVAVNYTTAQAQALQLEVNRLSDELAQLRYAQNISGTTYDSATVDANTRDALFSASVLKARQSYGELEELAPRLKGMILRRGADGENTAALLARIGEKAREHDRLEKQASLNITSIGAPTSGYFSGSVDGYETLLTPDSVSTFSPDDLEHLAPAAQPAGAVGRLIRDDTWYYAAIVPESYAKDLQPGHTASVRFASGFDGELTMEISHVGAEQAGKCVVLFSCGNFVQNATLLRKQSADITFRTYSGLRVPKDEVRVDEKGRSGVFVLESRKAIWKTIEILYELPDSYIVALDKSSTANLWPEDQLILNRKDLESGKVVI